MTRRPSTGDSGHHASVVHVDFDYPAGSTRIDYDVQDTMGASISELPGNDRGQRAVHDLIRVESSTSYASRLRNFFRIWKRLLIRDRGEYL